MQTSVVFEPAAPPAGAASGELSRSPLRRRAEVPAHAPGETRAPARIAPSSPVTSPKALTAAIAATSPSPIRTEAKPIPPGLERSTPKSFPTVAPAPAPTAPSAGVSAAAAAAAE